MCNKRYTSKTKNKEIRSVSGKTDSPMSFLSCSLFLWLNPHLDSASFSPLLYLLLHYPFLISLYICNQICIFPKTPTPSPPSNSLDPPGLDPGIRPCVESVPEPEDSSPVLTWILGYFWSLPRGVSPRLEWGHARALSSRAVAAVSRFPSRGSRVLWLSLQGFPRSFPMRLFHRAVPGATVV